jgi:thiol-disulfide isomerase/thioredoxin
MKKRLWVFSLLILTAVIVSACNPGSADPNQPAVEAEPMMEETQENQQPADEAEPALAPGSLPSWFGIEMTDVNTGMVFTVADFHGKVVLVETMAVWCPTCLRQQNEMDALLRNLGNPEDLIALSINTDPNEDVPLLTNHVKNNGFDWVFAIAPAEVNDQIAELYGAQFLNPPSTPMLIIDRQGGAHILPFGLKSAADLESAVQPFLDEG